MDNVMLVGLSRQVALRRNMDMIANNLANMNTTAYKAEQVLFEEYTREVTDDSGQKVDVSFVLDRGISRDFAVGRFETTLGDLDFGLNGSGFFVVETPEGERYTRNGHFRLDTEGNLVNAQGHRVLDEDGRPITINPEDGKIEVAGDGTFSTGGAETNRKLQVVEFENPQLLVKAGLSLYDAGEEVPIPAEDTTVVQGVLENSNVVPILEMTRMIEVSRAYQSTQRMVENNGKLLEQAIRELGKPAS